MGKTIGQKLFGVSPAVIRSRLVAISGAIAAFAAVPSSSPAAITYRASILNQLVDFKGLSPPSESFDPYHLVAANGQTVGYYNASTGFHAIILPGVSGGATDLNPTGFVSSKALATNGNQQVGTGAKTTNGNSHALLWTGSAASAIDLAPTQLTSIGSTYALDVHGAQEVGYGAVNPATSFIHHALLWTGSGSSAVDLNPTNLTGITDSVADNTDGIHQVGDGNSHAMMWSGTANSAVDLHPTAPAFFFFSQSYALGVNGNQEVGYGIATSDASADHALLWSGTAASAVDLNPTALTRLHGSIAVSTNGSQQVGYGLDSTDEPQAILWFGTAASAVDLQPLLPTTSTWISSKAISVDTAGNVFGIARTTVNLNNYYSVEWSPVPEPASSLLLMIGGISLICRGRR